MTVSEETLIAWADGELEAGDRARVDAAMAADASLRARAEAHAALRRRAAAAYAPVADEPLPQGLLDLIAAGGAGDARVIHADFRPRRWGKIEIGAVAAALVVGIAVGGPLMQSVMPDPAISSDGVALLAGGELARALERDAADGPDTPRPVRVGLTFRSREGRWCRTFTARDGGGLAGVACRQDGDWRVAMTAATPRTPETEMRMAASDTPTVVLEAVDQMMTGQALDAAAERAALEGRWRE